jgi:hypothetical protein
MYTENSPVQNREHSEYLKDSNHMKYFSEYSVIKLEMNN